MNHNCSILESKQQILAFKDQWQTLHNDCECKSIYNSFEFTYHSLCEFKDSTLKNHIVVISNNEDTIAIFPFQIYFEKRYIFTFRIMEYIAQDEIDKPCPIIKKGHEFLAWEYLYEYLNDAKRNWDILSLMEVRSSARDKDINRELCSESNYMYRINQDKAGPEIRLNKPWSEFWNSHKKMRKKVHKIQTDYKEDLSFKINELPWQESLEIYMILENKSWKKGRVGINKDTETASFYKNYYQELALKHQLHFGFLYIKEQVISAEIAYSLDDKVYFSHGCYDQEYQKYSPGMVSTCLFIKHFMDKKYSKGDFLCGYSGYLNAWSESTVDTYQVDIYNRSFNNAILFIFRAFKKILKLPIRSVLNFYNANVNRSS